MVGHLPTSNHLRQRTHLPPARLPQPPPPAMRPPCRPLRRRLRCRRRPAQAASAARAGPPDADPHAAAAAAAAAGARLRRLGCGRHVSPSGRSVPMARPRGMCLPAPMPLMPGCCRHRLPCCSGRAVNLWIGLRSRGARGAHAACGLEIHSSRMAGDVAISRDAMPACRGLNPYILALLPCFEPAGGAAPEARLLRVPFPRGGMPRARGPPDGMPPLHDCHKQLMNAWGGAAGPP